MKILVITHLLIFLIWEHMVSNGSSLFMSTTNSILLYNMDMKYYLKCPCS
jgi:hypothetical protein